MKFAIASIILYLFAENVPSASASARSRNRKLSKGSKVKNSSYETNPVSAHHTVITIRHVPADLDPIDNRNDSEGDLIPVPAVQCEECTDEPSPWMSFHSKECATWSLTAERCAFKSLYWLSQGFCQASCASLGFLYEGSNCCQAKQVSSPTPLPPTTTPPTSAPSTSPVAAEVESTNRNDNNCVVCDDRQTQYMIDNNKQCSTWNYVSTRCQSKTTFWQTNQFCRFTCAQLGHPYEDDEGAVCCGITPSLTDGPSARPSSSPSLSPSSSPSSDPSTSPTTAPSTQPFASPSSLPSSVPSALPSANPSSLPSSVPSALPSRVPTTLPSANPSALPSSIPSASPTDAVASDTNKDCVPCTNEVSDSMEVRGLTCEAWHKVEDRCYDKRPGWINNRFCELGCYIAGLPYDSTKKCCLDVTPRNHIVPTPSPSPGPSHAPSPSPTLHPSPSPTSKPTPAQVVPDNRSCIQCHDKRTPWMIANDKYCDSWSFIPYRCTDQSSYYTFWAREKFCQQSCFDAGHPYSGDECCPPTAAPSSAPTPAPTSDPSGEPSHVPSPSPTLHPSPSPTGEPTPAQVVPDNRSCIQCHDKRTPWMIANDKYCDSWGLIPYRCTDQSSYYTFWAREKFCQQSCFDAGHPYSGDECCPPTPAPTPVPTSDPSEEGDCFTYTRECGANKPCADSSACCSAWGHCGYEEAWCGKCCQGGNCFDSDDGLRYLRGGDTFLVNNMTDASFGVN